MPTFPFLPPVRPDAERLGWLGDKLALLSAREVAAVDMVVDAILAQAPERRAGNGLTPAGAYRPGDRIRRAR